MASSIALSVGIRNALSSIQDTQANQRVQQQRLATGKKVNSALDNPANYFTAAGLSNRASDLGSLLDSIGQATKTLEAASKGIDAIKGLIDTAKGAARQALQSASANLSVGSSAALAGGAGKTAVAGDAGNLVIKAGSVTTTVAVAAGDTVQKVVDALNADGTGLKAEVGSDNKLKISALKGESLEVDASTTAATASFVGVSAGAVARTAANSSDTRTTLANQFNDLRTQIDQLAKDSGYNGVNLLDGDALGVQFNEKNTSSLTIKGVSLSSTGLGVKATSIDATTKVGFQTDASINDALTNLGKATDALRAQASTFGSNLSVVQNRQDFTKGLIDTLQTGSDQLVLADASEESAKLLTLNTRSQLATTSLSLANQADQGVLRLF